MNLTSSVSLFVLIKFVTKKIICNPGINSTPLTLKKQEPLNFKLYRRGIITKEEKVTMQNKINNEVRKSKKNITTLSLKKIKVINV